MKELNGIKVLLGLSGGINSQAVLCWLIKTGYIPSELHLYYAHFVQHSPDTFKFVADGIRLARKHFPCVKVKISRNDVLRFFKEQKMIPHPMFSPCSRILKIEAIAQYAYENEVRADLVGYVKHEFKRRVGRKKESANPDMFGLDKHYPISEFTDEWCFEIVDEMVGWHPKIYDIRDANGKRLFNHNNCLPCKNMTTEQMEAVKIHFPEYHKQAMKLSEELKRHWGRDEALFYSTFGRDLGQETTCEVCTW